MTRASKAGLLTWAIVVAALFALQLLDGCAPGPQITTTTTTTTTAPPPVPPFHGDAQIPAPRTPFTAIAEQAAAETDSTMGTALRALAAPSRHFDPGKQEAWRILSRDLTAYPPAWDALQAMAKTAAPASPASAGAALPDAGDAWRPDLGAVSWFSAFMADTTSYETKARLWGAPWARRPAGLAFPSRPMLVPHRRTRLWLFTYLELGRPMLTICEWAPLADFGWPQLLPVELVTERFAEWRPGLPTGGWVRVYGTAPWRPAGLRPVPMDWLHQMAEQLRSAQPLPAVAP